MNNMLRYFAEPVYYGCEGSYPFAGEPVPYKTDYVTM